MSNLKGVPIHPANHHRELDLGKAAGAGPAGELAQPN